MPTITNVDKITELRKRTEELHLGGGKDRIEKQHAQGKLSARERIDQFCDRNTFLEFSAFAEHRCTLFGMAGKPAPADGVVTGSGRVDGRFVHMASQDFTVFGGSAGEVHCDKVVEAMNSALKTGTPFVFMNDSGGARIQEGVDSLSGYAKVFYANTELSGVVPQISMICGPCAGGAAYSPALTDFIIQTRQAQMFITGPSVIKQVTGEVVSAEELGGAEAQMHYSGVVHFIAEDDEHAIGVCRRLLSFLPSNNLEDPPMLPGEYSLEPEPSLNELIPDDPKKPYDVRDAISKVVDFGDFMEVQETFAENIVVGFGRLAGRTIGVLANQPKFFAGVLDINSSDKAARFIRFCNAFNIPLVTFVDTPGFLPGVSQEYGGIIRHGAKMLFAYSAATVPKLTVIMRKAYGGAYVAMCSRELGADRVFAWPTAEIAVMGAEGAAEIVFKREIEQAEDKAAARANFTKQYRDTFSTPYVAGARRLVDNIIEPSQTRLLLAQALESLVTKRELRPSKKHGLMPL
ncbi:MAG: acyl-CoA carboxylase subunit beta [Armatimonadetes bacterium]|nr:acyl-CoA carboxylase subunit beta [Armatimonadota bacterium]